MELIFRMKEALRIPMILVGMHYDETVTTDDVDPKGAGLYIYAENNVEVIRLGGSTLDLMDPDTLGSYDPYALIDISDE